MSAKIVSSLADDSCDLHKQIGRINGMFQILDHNHFVTQRSESYLSYSIQLLGVQNQLKSHIASTVVIGKDIEVPKEKSSVSCSFSATSSVLDCTGTAQPETPPRQTVTPRKPIKIQDFVKESMYREAHGLPIRPHEKRYTVTNLDDLPRPLQQSKLRKATLEKLQRLSLCSKASCIQHASLESRTNPLGHNLPNGTNHPRQLLSSQQETATETQPSSIVAKLMGLDSFPNTFSIDARVTKSKSSTNPVVAYPSKLSITAIENKQNQFSPTLPIAQNIPALLSPYMHIASPIGKQSIHSRLPKEQALQRQQNSNQVSPKIAAERRKDPTSTLFISSPVYGETEKKTVELKFQRSGKDLGAHKQTLEAIHETRRVLGNQKECAKLMIQKGCRQKDKCSNQNLHSFTCQNRKTCQHVPIINSTGPPMQLSSLDAKPAPATETEKDDVPTSTWVPIMTNMQSVRPQDLRCQKDNSRCSRNPKDHKPGRYNIKEHTPHLPSTEKKITLKNNKQEQIIRATPSTGAERGFRMENSRLQQVVRRVDGKSHPTTPPSNLGRLRRDPTKKRRDCSDNQKHKTMLIDLHLSDAGLRKISDTRHSCFLGDTASKKSESNSCFISINSGEQASVSISKEHMPTVELTVNIMEQPSPVSVLNSTFYNESLPSPVKKIPTAFQGDANPRANEAECPLANLNQLTNCTRCDAGSEYNHKSENLGHRTYGPQLFNPEPNQTAEKHNQLAYQSSNPEHRYINKILLAAGLLRDTSILATPYQLLTSSYLINHNLFNALEETEISIESNEESIEKSDWMKLSQKMRRKIVFDMLSEIMVCRISLRDPFTVGMKLISLEGVIKEVCSEVDHLCRMPSCNLEEKDKLVRILTEDTEHPSDDWTSYNNQLPALVLDIERLIFKDMINEVVADEVLSHYDWLNIQTQQLTQYFFLS